MRLLGTIFLVFAYCWADDISSSAVFDCNRIDIAFCCTTRVRTICADHCRDVQCGVQETGVPDENTANIRRAIVFTRESSQSGGIAMPKSSISEEVAPPRGESTALEQPSSRWNVKVLPAQKLITWPEEAKLPPHYAVDGDSSKPDESEIQPDDKTLIKTFSIAPSKANMIPAGIIDYIEPKVIQFINHVRTTQKPFRMSKNGLRSSRPRSRPTATTVPLPVRQATTPLPPQPRPIFNKPMEPMQPQPNVPIPPVTQPTCGVAPDFTPCVSSEEASHALMDCCRRKNLPAGCLSLCRYDITQAEVRSAMDRGLCGIFSVAPYLECASQGKDNTECCRYKGLAQKTGPQCEQFCRPSYGLSALGLQHIVCGNAIGDMLHCHHAGIRR